MEQITIYKQDLKKVNQDLEVEVHNLIYLLKHINIENINLYNNYIKINDLINKRRLLLKLIEQNKF